MPIPIAIVDDKLQSRVSLSEKIIYTKEIVVLFTASNGEDFLAKMKALKTGRPQAVLMDIEMPLVNGIEAVAIGASLFPETKFLMLTVFDDEDKIFEAIQAGASGYLLKDERVDKIINCIKEMVEEGGAPMSPGIARKAFAILSKANLSEKTAEEHTDLSSREMEILKLLVEGYDFRSTAERLSISPNTVRKHIGNIYQKLHVNSKAQAIRLAMRKRWI